MRNILCCLLLVSIASFSQNVHLKTNEEIIFTFKTIKGKTVTLAKDKTDNYIVYRYGSAKNIEFQYPEILDSSSWEKFTYSYYLRGGGMQNAGLDLNYIEFRNKEYKYVIYDTYSAEDNTSETGIKVTNTNTGLITDIQGNIKTRSGILTSFRDNELIDKSDELYED
jgi:hypothetical protein